VRPSQVRSSTTPATRTEAKCVDQASRARPRLERRPMGAAAYRWGPAAAPGYDSPRLLDKLVVQRPEVNHGHADHAVTFVLQIDLLAGQSDLDVGTQR